MLDLFVCLYLIMHSTAKKCIITGHDSTKLKVGQDINKSCVILNTRVHFAPFFGAAISSVRSQMRVYSPRLMPGCTLYRVPGAGSGPGGSWETRAQPPANGGDTADSGAREEAESLQPLVYH